MMRKSALALLLGTAVVAGGCQKKDEAPKGAASPAAALTEDQKAVQAFGALVGRQVADRKSTRLNSSHPQLSRMPSSA